jgi:lysophospholipid acyltransferase (LPLAT)-like uncharacterized protein
MARNKPLGPWSRFLLWVGSIFLRLWYRTLHAHVHPDLHQLAMEKRPLLWAFWHQNLFIAGAIRRWIRRREPVCAIISASQDGEWLAQFLREFSIEAVRGSSNHGGYDVYRAALGKLAIGSDIVITPDGPTGPSRRCKKGIVRLASTAELPIVVLRFRFSHAISLKTWDNFRVPLPFSRVEIDHVLIKPEELITMSTVQDKLFHIEESLNQWER